MNRDSCCYKCSDHTGTCRATCPFARAEAKQRAADRRRQLIERLGKYDNGLKRTALRQIQFDRTGGR
jgi:hypothetical protein